MAASTIDSINTLHRWHQAPEMDPEDFEAQLLKAQKRFKNYKYSVFVLQHAALKIQHWYFKIKVIQQFPQSYYFSDAQSSQSQCDEERQQEEEHLLSVNDITHRKGAFSLSIIDPMVEQYQSGSGCTNDTEQKEMLFLADNLNLSEQFLQKSEGSGLTLVLESIEQSDQQNSMASVQTPKFDQFRQNHDNPKDAKKGKVFVFNEQNPVTGIFNELSDVSNQSSSCNSSLHSIDNCQTSRIVEKAVQIKGFKNPFRQSVKQDKDTISLQLPQQKSSKENSKNSTRSSIIQAHPEEIVHFKASTQPSPSSKANKENSSMQSYVSPIRECGRFDQLKEWMRQFDQQQQVLHQKRQNLTCGNNCQPLRTLSSQAVPFNDSKGQVANITLYENDAESLRQTFGTKNTFKECESSLTAVKVKAPYSRTDFSFDIQNMNKEEKGDSENKKSQSQQIQIDKQVSKDSWGRAQQNFRSAKRSVTPSPAGICQKDATPGKQRRTRAQRLKQREENSQKMTDTPIHNIDEIQVKHGTQELKKSTKSCSPFRTNQSQKFTFSNIKKSDNDNPFNATVSALNQKMYSTFQASGPTQMKGPDKRNHRKTPPSTFNYNSII